MNPTAWVVVASIAASGVQPPPRDTSGERTGAIASAITREAKRLAAAQPAGPQRHWSRVRQLRPGSEITISLNAGPGLNGHFVIADASTLVMLTLAHPAMPERAKSLLLQVASMRAEDFTPRRGAFIYKELRVGADGVFIADQRVADRDEIVRVIERSEIAQVSVPLEMRGSARGAIGGAAAGFGLGFVAMLSTIDCPYAGNCGAWRARRWAPVWLPVALGTAGYHLLRKPSGGVIYRSIATAPP